MAHADDGRGDEDQEEDSEHDGDGQDKGGRQTVVDWLSGPNCERPGKKIFFLLSPRIKE